MMHQPLAAVGVGRAAWLPDIPRQRLLPDGFDHAGQEYAAAVWAAMSPSARLACRRIMIVEDEQIIAWHLGEIVERLGFKVCGSAMSETEAVTLALESRPDLILMDVWLGRGGDGVDAARTIHRHFQVPIVFCSAYTDEPETLARMRGAGAAGILSKPIMPKVLGAMLSKIFVPPDAT
jgi:CheY-like chemotaxis protein